MQRSCLNSYHKKSRRFAPNSTVLRWIKFNFVGGVGIAVQFGALLLLKSIFHLNYLAATGIAVEAAVMHNFVWHEQFTWVDRTGAAGSAQRPWRWRDSLRRLLRFHLANGSVSILGNLALMKVMVGLGHMNYLLANAIAIAVCSLANFVVSEEWVFEETMGEDRLYAPDHDRNVRSVTRRTLGDITLGSSAQPCQSSCLLPAPCTPRLRATVAEPARSAE